MDYTIFLWEPYICAHILPWAHGLVKDKRVKAVYYIAPCAVIAYRKEMGWSENDIPKNDGVNYIIAPDDKKLKEIYETDTDTAIHIYHGLAVNKIEGHYFKFGLKYKINRSICYEGPKTLFHPLWQHYLNFYLRKYMYEPTLKSKACLKCLYFTIIIFDLCRYLEYFSYLCTIN